MTRAAVLPTPGDPFLVAAWLHLYKKVWKTEVDKLYIHLNSRLEDPVINYTKRICEEAGAIVSYSAVWEGHGEALLPLIENCAEDFVYVAEDDGYILRPTIVSQCIELVEQNKIDCVANGRVSAAESLWKREAEVFGLEGQRYYEPNFWPCFFFSRTQTLLDTDRDFAAKNWPAGTYIKELDWTAPENVSADTFGWTSIQLRAKGLRIFLLPDGRSTTQDAFLFHQRQGIFANPPTAPWIHFGSSSSGIGWALQDERGINLECRTRTTAPSAVPVCPDDHIKDDAARRLAFWRLCRKYHPIKDCPEAEYFNQVYVDAMDRFEKLADLRKDQLANYTHIYTETFRSMWE